MEDRQLQHSQCKPSSLLVEIPLCQPTQSIFSRHQCHANLNICQIGLERYYSRLVSSVEFDTLDERLHDISEHGLDFLALVLSQNCGPVGLEWLIHVNESCA